VCGGEEEVKTKGFIYLVRLSAFAKEAERRRGRGLYTLLLPLLPHPHALHALRPFKVAAHFSSSSITACNKKKTAE
jgi:hypothetical protein